MNDNISILNQNSVWGNRRHTTSRRVVNIDYQLQVVEDINAEAVMLLQYYYSISTSPTHNLNDDAKVAKRLRMSKHTVKRYRLKLTKAKYIKFISKTIKGIRINLWLFTKEVIEDYARNREAYELKQINTIAEEVVTDEIVPETTVTYIDECKHHFSINPATGEEQCFHCGAYPE